MKNIFLATKALVLCIIFSGFSAEKTAGGSATVPAHPSQLVYPPLSWNTPLGAPYRTVLKNGLCVYAASDMHLPLVRICAYFRLGTLLDPTGKEGLVSLMSLLMRTGGTNRYHPDTLDALIDQYALQISVSASGDNIRLNASFLSDYSDTAFDIIEQVLMHPKFDEKKLEKEKKIFAESVRHRFDNPGPTIDMAYQKMVYAGSPAGTLATEKSIGRITRLDLVTFHQKMLAAGTPVFSIAGRFDRNAMLERLEKLFPVFPKTGDTAFPKINEPLSGKCLIVHKPISQVYATFGVPLFKRPNPDYYPVSVANLILGGGGFTSRLGTRVRSDEGLTYSIHSDAESNYTYPATWNVDFFTKNESFPRAMTLSLEVIDSMRRTGPTEKELINAKNSLIEEMPSMFRTAFDIVSTYAWNEYYGRPQDIFKVYPDSIRAIKREAIKRVMDRYFAPSSFSYAIVGDTAVLSKFRSAGGLDFCNATVGKTVVPDSIPFLP